MGRGREPQAAACPALRAPPRCRRGPPAAAPCAAPEAGAESPPQLLGLPCRVPPSSPPAPFLGLTGRMEPPEGANRGEIVEEVKVPPAVLGVPTHGAVDSCHASVTEEEATGIPIPAPGLLQVTERRQPLSSVSSLEVHFDLLDLTELTDMSDQELAEVFADSDDENLTTESPAGLHPLPRASCLQSPSWTRTRAEQNRDKHPPGDPEQQATIVHTFLTSEGPKEE